MRAAADPSAKLYRVELTGAAEHDLEDIHTRMEQRIGAAAADAWLDRIQERVTRLAVYPKRGHLPYELKGFTTAASPIREVQLPPFRIVYRIAEEDRRVDVLAIFHRLRGPRDPLRARLDPTKPES